ncbi:MAG: N-acetyl-alpha-D-glucosaminyl L-malate synthase BshA, partial [Flavobacteriaceae bacterium]
FLSNERDVEDMTINALYILQDEELLKTFKEQAKKVADKFDITKVLPLYESVYEKAFKVNYKNTY